MKYRSALNERERLITHSNQCEKNANKCDDKSKDLLNLDEDITSSINKTNVLQAELEGLKGVFKKKAREECQRKIEEQEQITNELLERLYKEHDIAPEKVVFKLHEYSNEKLDFINEKTVTMEKTNKVEGVSKQAVYEYKYYKALSDTQQIDMKDITDRINDKIIFLPGEEKIFRLTQEDRRNLLKDYEDEIDPKIIEKCKENFDNQNEMERQVRTMKSVEIKSIEWGRER